MNNVAAAQGAVEQSAEVDAWLLYDFRGNNDYLWQLLGRTASMTRRCYMFIPTVGVPTAVVHFVDKPQFPSGDHYHTIYYSTWQELYDLLRRHLAGMNSVAMEYSPFGELPTVSIVDAGFVELVRSYGTNVVSSAPLFQQALATWTKEGRASHYEAVDLVYRALDSGLELVRDRLMSSEPVNEFDVQCEIMKKFADYNLETEDRPIVAVNHNSGDPHYEPSEEVHSQIGQEDWLLVDLWARHPGEQNIFADITWMCYVGSVPPRTHTDAFNAVRDARDAVVQALEAGWAAGDFSFYGWQLDDIARNVLLARGYGEFVRHRTGHSIGPGRFLHALGVNLDNLETHDTRPVRPGVGFSVEPGIYTPKFGVRSEINVFIDPDTGPTVTTPPQQEVQLLLT